jgi:hypothetical protein
LRALGLGILALAACSPSDRSLMPLREGTVWTYAVERDFDSSVAEWKVVGRAAVGSESGYEIRSPLGSSRLAWQGDRLVASQLAGTRYDPPMPLLAPDGTPWSGTVHGTGRAGRARASVARETATEETDGRKRSVTVSTVTIKADGWEAQVTTWFVAGVGAVRQEQRTDGRLDVRAELIAGP